MIRKATVTLPSPDTTNLGTQDYARMRAECADDSCCLTSVAYMQKVKAYLLKPGEKCPPAFEQNQLKCLSSYRWCQQRSNLPR
ncbi:MAG: hypothetical protein NDJ89_01925 [Oligoflexia bacterium]|nr:hypothetical protein [Oligoflexia bacterium]